MSTAEAAKLRLLPPVNDVLGHDGLADLAGRFGREAVVGWVRAAVEELRDRVATGDADVADREESTMWAVRRARELAEAHARRRLAKVLNLTGVVLHTGLGRAPLSERAMRAVEEAARHTNLEVDIETGERRYRGYQIEDAWRQLTGAEAVLVLNNNAAATLVTLEALCGGARTPSLSPQGRGPVEGGAGREVIVSRGQLVEIGGSFRIPEILAKSGAVLREVGTTNRTRLADYERAITPQTAALLHVHTSNYRLIGFTETPSLAEMAKLAHERGLLAIDDIGSGCLVDLAPWGLPAEPTAQASVAAGADVVLFSGDKLLGGPQCGVVLGKKELVGRVKRSPLARAMRVDKLALAALSATLDSYLQGRQFEEIPVLKLLTTPAEELGRRAAAVVERVAGRSRPAGGPYGALRLEIGEETALVGGGSLPGATLPTRVIRLRCAGVSADELARRLRLGSPRVFGRVQDDAVILDLRSLVAEEDELLVEGLRGLAEAVGRRGEAGN